MMSFQKMNIKYTNATAAFLNVSAKKISLPNNSMETVEYLST